MSTIVKDSEVSAAVPEALSAKPAAGAVPSEAPGKPQPVALEVSVTVNGARTVEGSDKREPFSESTKTVLVFGNGAVIRLQSSVAPGQLLFLTNEKTKKEVVCQVVKSKNYRNVSGYVELEFTEPVIGFWGMRFPGDRLAPATPPAASVPAPVAAVPSTPISSLNKIPVVPQPSPASPLAATLIAAPKITTPPQSAEVQEVKSSSAPISQTSPAKPAPESVPVVPASTVTPITPFVPKFDNTTTSSSALSSASVITLPRAAQAKPPVSRPAVPQVISGPALTPEISAGSVKPAAAPKSAAENSADALRAENARLQEQLSAFLFADDKKNAHKAVDKIASAPVAENKSAETADKIFDLAQLAAELNAEPKSRVAEPVIAPVTPVPPRPPAAPVLAKPATPAKVSVAPFKSLLDDEEVKVPSWLEPLARNATIPAPPEEDVVSSEISAEPAPLPYEESAATSSDSHFAELSSVPAPNFGGRLLINGKEDQSESSSDSSKTFLFGALAAGIIAAAVGGYWYTHQTPTNSGAATGAPAIQQPADSTVTAAQIAPPTATQSQRTAAAVPGVLRPAGAIVDQAPTPAPQNANLAVKDNRSAASAIPAAANSVLPSAAQPSAAQPPVAQNKRAQLGDVHLAAPKVNRNGSAETLGEAELAIGTTGSTPENAASLDENFASNSGPLAPAVPVPVGGVVKSAQLLKSVPPIYPPFAKTQRITGDVKIDALIDGTGHVTAMKVVSGPAVLHQPAMDALRQWKYQPAILNGNSVPSHLTVVIQFRM
jgi:TonB family protein